jgi:antitoxin VapB
VASGTLEGANRPVVRSLPEKLAMAKTIPGCVTRSFGEVRPRDPLASLAKTEYIFSGIYSVKEAVMRTAKVFKNGQSQAVRLPKEFRVAGDEVYIKKTGNVIVLIPKRHPWDTLVASLEKFSPDFLAERDQPETQGRESFE